MPFVRGERFPVEFLGWTSDLASLQRNGWRVAECDDRHNNSFRVAISHPEHHMSGVSDDINRESLFRQRIRYSRELPPMSIHIDIAIKYMVEERQLRMPFFPVDTTPSIEGRSISLYDIYDAPYFQPIEEGKEIFLKKASVEEIMQIALDKQAPEQAEIRARQRVQRDREEYRRGGETKAKIIMVA